MIKIDCKCGYSCEMRLENFLLICKCGRIYKRGTYDKKSTKRKTNKK